MDQERGPQAEMETQEGVVCFRNWEQEKWDGPDHQEERAEQRRDSMAACRRRVSGLRSWLVADVKYGVSMRFGTSGLLLAVCRLSQKVGHRQVYFLIGPKFKRPKGLQNE